MGIVKILQWSQFEVRCGNPSQYQVQTENSDGKWGGGFDIPGKVKSELQKDLWMKGKYGGGELGKEHQKHQKLLGN